MNASDHEWIDCSMPVSSSMAVYPGDQPFIRTVSLTVDVDGCELSSIACSSHCGTHVDGQRHFVAHGMGVDEWPLERLMGDAWLVDAPISGEVTSAVLQDVPLEARRLIIRTLNTPSGSLKTGVQHAWLGVDTVRWMLERDIWCVLFDALSVEGPDTDWQVHRELLTAGVVLVEGVVMDNLEPGWWWVSCLPLRITHGDGAPARVVMRRSGGSPCAR